jgi:hypothetical protein
MNMKKYTLIFLLVLACTSGYSQVDSIRVFVIGGMRGEVYRFYFDGDLKLDFRTDGSYKYSFSIPFDSLYISRPYDFGYKLGSTKKRKFWWTYRNLDYIVPYVHGKVLVFYRHPARKVVNPFEIRYVDEAPPPPPDW